MKHANIIILLLTLMGCGHNGWHDIVDENRTISNENKSELIRGVRDGERSAKSDYSSEGWAAGGFFGGLFLGLVGGGLVVGLSQSGEVRPSFDQTLLIIEKSKYYKDGYSYGFSQQAKSKRLTNTIIGAAMGTAALVMAIIIVSSNDK
jgi:hypothetical protein